MIENKSDMVLEKWAKDYENDPEYIAEGLSLKVVEEMLAQLNKKGLTQSWLAEKMGVSRAHISKILNAAPNMTFLTLAKIAVALGTKPEVTLGDEIEKPNIDIKRISNCYAAADDTRISYQAFPKNI